jgi:hypothetical protein
MPNAVAAPCLSAIVMQASWLSMRLLCKLLIPATLAHLASADCQAQSVYSLAIYAGGESFQEICSLDLPFPLSHYRVTQRSRYEDADGLVIMDLGHEKERGGVLCRYLDVELGSASFTVPLDRPQPEKARRLMADSAAKERREKEWLGTGFFQVKTFILTNRTDSASDQEALFNLYDREKFRDGYWTRAMGPESNVVRITASTNDMVIWEKVIREFDKPHTK